MSAVEFLCWVIDHRDASVGCLDRSPPLRRWSVPPGPGLCRKAPWLTDNSSECVSSSSWLWHSADDWKCLCLIGLWTLDARMFVVSVRSGQYTHANRQAKLIHGLPRQMIWAHRAMISSSWGQWEHLKRHKHWTRIFTMCAMESWWSLNYIQFFFHDWYICSESATHHKITPTPQLSLDIFLLALSAVMMKHVTGTASVHISLDCCLFQLQMQTEYNKTYIHYKQNQSIAMIV